MSESTIVRSNLPCDSCGSRDNAKLYSDGHTFCFGCGFLVPGDGEIPTTPPRRAVLGLIDPGNPQGLSARKLTEETCAHFGYTVGEYHGSACQIAPYYNRDGSLVAQKVRLKGKDFKWLGGDIHDAMPFGWHCFPHAGRKVVLTEGEVDALSMSQVQGNAWPVWSIPTGAGPQLRKWLAHVKEQGAFEGFETVVVMFDNDDRGREASKVAAEILGAKCKIAELPLKDANEMLVAGRTEELVKAFWNAQTYRPDGIVDMQKVREAALAPRLIGPSYPWTALTDMLYGQHTGEIVTWVAGTGVGKTDALYQLTAHNVMTHGEKVGAFLLESTPDEVALAVTGKWAGKRFHLPDGSWTDDEKADSYDSVMSTGRLFLYDSQGEDTWGPIKEKIEYLHHAEGVRVFLVDHIMALVADADDDRKAIDEIMKDMRRLVIRLGITIHLVSHLNRPLGKAFEEGGQVALKNLRGSGATAAWSWIVLALERNQQSEDATERTITTLRVLKMRRDGSKVGRTVRLKYDERTGLLNEIPDNPFQHEESPADAGLSDF